MFSLLNFANNPHLNNPASVSIITFVIFHGSALEPFSQSFVTA